MRILSGLILVACTFMSCEYPCHDSENNETLRSHSYTDHIYQEELLTLVAQEEGVRYFFVSRDSTENVPHLVVEARGRAFCGKLQLLLETEDRYTRKLQNNAGYTGAELRGLTFQTVARDLQVRLAYQDMETIID